MLDQTNIFPDEPSNKRPHFFSNWDEADRVELHGRLLVEATHHFLQPNRVLPPDPRLPISKLELTQEEKLIFPTRLDMAC